MSTRSTVASQMRVYHRYLGFFLAGIMAVYALTGVILIFRQTDFLKQETHNVKTLAPNLSDKEVGEQLKVRDLRLEGDGPVKKFKLGTYNSETGVADYTEKKYGFILEKLMHLHKATTKDPLFYLNIFFGAGLLFFVVSSFFMFMPGTNVFKKGLYFTLAGIVLTLIMLFV
ncbi:MAG: hypothetical protein JST49_13820 [Bacteroidetes bacterium]|nr:hypothetical protein [Bacteroidota bacterium]